MDNVDSEVFGTTWNSRDMAYIKEKVWITHSSNAIITSCREHISMPSGGHKHRNYEFIIPKSGMPLIQIEDRNISSERNKVIPINSRQFHGLQRESDKCMFTDITVKEAYLQELSNIIYGRSTVSFDNSGFHLDQDIRSLIRMFIDEYSFSQSGSGFILDSLTMQISIKLLRYCSKGSPDAGKEDYCYGRNDIKRAAAFIDEHYNMAFSLEEIAGVAKLSPYHFSRMFRKYTGRTPNTYLMERKVAEAKRMLGESQKSITEICFSCGFNNLSHFSTVFKRMLGVSPSEYRSVLRD